MLPQVWLPGPCGVTCPTELAGEASKWPTVDGQAQGRKMFRRKCFPPLGPFLFKMPEALGSCHLGALPNPPAGEKIQLDSWLQMLGDKGKGRIADFTLTLGLV